MRLLSPLPVLALALSVHAADPVIKPNPGAPRPNVIVILTDDMGYSDVGCYGSEIPTPNLDSLASRGVRFTQFYNTARCCSTRAALLTGLYSHQAGVGHMTEDKGLPGYRGMLNEHCVTLAQVARGAGYGTYMTGKWHVTTELKPVGPKTNWPLQRGFDHLYGTIIGGGNYFDPALLCRDNAPITAVTDKEYQPANGYYYTDAIGDHASKFIAQHVKATPGKPFFLYCAFTAAHWPMHARPEDVAKYKGKYDAGYEPVRKARLAKMRELGIVRPEWKLSEQAGDWDAVKDKEWEARCMEVYAAMVDRMDQNVGKIVSTLRENNQLDNTLILYLQDNGACAEPTGRTNPPGVPLERPAKPTLTPWAPDYVDTSSTPTQTRDGYPIRRGPGVMPGDRDTHIAYGRSWANVSNTPFREYKHWEHEGGISTPLIAHWPKGIARTNALERQPAHLIDVMATLVDVAGAAYPPAANPTGSAAVQRDITPLEGASLVPAFDGKPIARKDSALYFEHEGNRAVRDGKWKLVAKGPGGAWELYDMEADRTETNNLASANPDKVKELAGKWDAWAKRAHAVPWPWKPAYGEAADGAEAPKGKGRRAGGAFSHEKHFTLKPGDVLTGEAAPDTGGKALTIAAHLDAVGDGVIVAQGGTAHGFTLYVKDGVVTFAARINNKLHSVAAKEKLPADQAVDLVAKLAADGTATLSAGGKLIATGKFPGVLARTPADGLSAGADSNAAVGPYEAPFEFKGKVGEVKVDLD